MCRFGPGSSGRMAAGWAACAAQSNPLRFLLYVLQPCRERLQRRLALQQVFDRVPVDARHALQDLPVIGAVIGKGQDCVDDVGQLIRPELYRDLWLVLHRLHRIP